MSFMVVEITRVLKRPNRTKNYVRHMVVGYVILYHCFAQPCLASCQSFAYLLGLVSGWVVRSLSRHSTADLFPAPSVTTFNFSVTTPSCAKYPGSLT